MPSILPTIPAADGTKCWWRAHLATLCPICRRNVGRWDIPTANILPSLPTFYPICILDKMFPDLPSCLPTGPSADKTKCWQMGCPICRRARLQTGHVARWAGHMYYIVWMLSSRLRTLRDDSNTTRQTHFRMRWVWKWHIKHARMAQPYVHFYSVTWNLRF